MNAGIQVLELAIGIKDVLIRAGFTTIDSLVRRTPSEISAALGIEVYVAKLIVDAAKRAAKQSDSSHQNPESERWTTAKAD